MSGSRTSRKWRSNPPASILLSKKPISAIEFITNKTSQINEISSLVKKKGLTEVKIKVKDKDNELVFKLKNKRLVDRKSINKLKNQDISTIIH